MTLAKGVITLMTFADQDCCVRPGVLGMLSRVGTGGRFMRWSWIVGGMMLAFLLVGQAGADTVYLKDGRSLWCQEAYEENDLVIVVRPEGVLRLPKSDVSRIEPIKTTLPRFYSPPPGAPAGAPGAPQTPGAAAGAGAPGTAPQEAPSASAPSTSSPAPSPPAGAVPAPPPGAPAAPYPPPPPPPPPGRAGAQ